MKSQLKKVKSRTYLFIGDDKIKMIPAIYHDLNIEEIVNSILDKSRKFLTNKERYNLEYIVFVNELKSKEPYVYELIEKSTVKEVRFVEVKFESDRYELLFENNVRLKCPSSLFKLNPESKIIKSDT